MEILVTGGAGFIGSHFVEGLLAGRYPAFAEARITVLDKLTYAGNRRNLSPHPRLNLAVGDILDRPVVDGLMAAADLVVHLAAETHVDRSIAGSVEFSRTNVVGTHVLLESAARAGIRFVHVSTDEVYGSIAHGSWDEKQPLLPNSPYSASKAGADLMARAYARTHGLDVVVTRCSNNYGPRQHPEKLIPRFVLNLLRGQTVPLYGDGLNVREWLHVEDHCRALALVAERGRGGQTYNIGGGFEISNRELTQMLLDAVGADADRVASVPDRPGHDARYSLDSSKITDELGFRPRIPFAQGLAATVAWYREHPDWFTADS
ncbi:dTDP-glucose 4,6-dehydratase [Kineosporia sp. NBRC 101731]|uniref:dTDP-glucose 4,6-dehydratase n=1 Tax=Kineosporia sp. NBRC 101731 TaxID=3032199 RepID=UPI0033243212